MLPVLLRKLGKDGVGLKKSWFLESVQICCGTEVYVFFFLLLSGRHQACVWSQNHLTVQTVSSRLPTSRERNLPCLPPAWGWDLLLFVISPLSPLPTINTREGWGYWNHFVCLSVWPSSRSVRTCPFSISRMWTFFFFYQTLYGSVLLWGLVSCTSSLSSMSRSQWRFMYWLKKRTISIMSSKGWSFGTILGLIVQCDKPKWPVEKWDYCIWGKGHSKDSKCSWMFVPWYLLNRRTFCYAMQHHKQECRAEKFIHCV